MVPLAKFNYVFLVPLIVLSLPSAAIFGQGLPVMLVLVTVGSAGMLTGRRIMSSLTSSALLGLIVWGRIASDVLGLGGYDTAWLLLEFFLVILLMEFSNTTILYESLNKKLGERIDDLSFEARVQLIGWARTQLLGLGKLIASAFILTLSLLVVGDIVSVSVNQIVFSAILVVVAVAALLVLVTFGREPEDRI